MCSFLWVTNIPLCIYTTTSLSIPRFWVFFLSHTAPGFQLWFYFHLYMWVAHWGLAPEAALRGLGLPLRGPGVEVVPLLGSQGFWPHQVLRGGVVARAAGNAVLRKGVATSGGQQAAVFWPGGSPLRQRPGRRSLRGRRVGQDGSDPVLGNTSLLCACGSPAPVRVGCGGGAAALLAGTLAGQRVQGLKLPPLKEWWPC